MEIIAVVTVLIIIVMYGFDIHVYTEIVFLTYNFIHCTVVK